jgi:aminoglycoside phosphotransferase (APT) family kinase protein
MTPLVGRLAAYSALPGAERLLDAESLSVLHGRATVPRRLRVKPGASVLVGHGEAREDAADGPGGDGIAATGWTLLTASRDKRDGVLRRAARTGAPVREHPAASGTFLLSGGLEADPRIGRSVHRVLRREVGADGADLRVLSYNPVRHAVIALPDGGDVLRIAARPLDRLLHLAQRWQELGVPTLPLHPTRYRSVVRCAHWGAGDLSSRAPGPGEPSAGEPAPAGSGTAGTAVSAVHELASAAAGATGAAIARLHAAPADGPLPAARLGPRLPATLAELEALLPHRTAAIAQLADDLAVRLPERPATGLLHGDLSPDQVLVGRPGGEARIRIIDLDRSGTGPLGADLGSWLAACLAGRDEHVGVALLEGYVAGGGILPTPDELAAWTARALLAAALDPVRRFLPRAGEAVEERLDLAAAVLADPSLLPAPGGAGPVLAPTGAGLVPAPTSASASAPKTAGNAAPGGPTPVLGPPQSAEIPALVHDGSETWHVERAWPDDGRGRPLELRGPGPEGEMLRGARMDALTGVITLQALGGDPRLPGLARTLSAHPGARIVSLRPGKRAVVRIDEGGRPARFVKIVRPGRAARLLDAIDRAHAFDGPFRTPQVLAADEDTVTFAALAGTTLHEPLSLRDGTWRRAWQEVLEAWADSCTRAGAAPPDVPVHGPEAEAEVLRQWRDRAADVDPGGAEGRERAVEAALRSLAAVPAPTRPALLHRDLHDKQILHLPGERPGLLDVDTACWGDPALDLGNLRAHARWRELQGLWSAGHAAELRALIDETARSSGISPEALAAYECSTLARLTCVYALRPRWRAHARTLSAEGVAG